MSVNDIKAAFRDKLAQPAVGLAQCGGLFCVQRQCDMANAAALELVDIYAARRRDGYLVPETREGARQLDDVRLRSADAESHCDHQYFHDYSPMCFGVG